MVVVVVVLLLTVGSQCSLTKSTTSPGIYIKVSSPLTCNGPTAATTTTTSTSYNTTSSRFGIISSPKRLGQIMCSWDIVNPQRETLLLSFTQFDLSDGPCMGYSRSCCSHWLSIYASGTKSLKYRRNERPYNHLESTLLQEFSMGLPGAGGILGGKRLCGSDPPAPVVTQASRVLLRYSQEAWIGRHSPAESGFRMVFFALTNGSTCEPNEITCSTSTLCLPRAHLCDGQVDCPDHSDEMKCPAKRQHAQKGCGADEWYCGVGQECYTASQRCDGTLQCSNAVDELSCNTKCQNEVACWGGGCYPFYQRCDGSPDCGDASDEANCSPLLCNGKNGTFLCNNRRCIRETWRCDQLDDCRDGSDEQDCLRNSVIGVAAMGGLMCSLMLVVAVGCTGRLYALKMGLTRLQSQGPGQGRGAAGG
ncbi:hypothetical protein O3P69_009242 [Scylla paramamosain]|uniref:CUB domain-containing protein n=1 Tax=Scylla paramamosain TaxID=85552 RepID=A0AAW0TCZ0_SCYPA